MEWRNYPIFKSSQFCEFQLTHIKSLRTNDRRNKRQEITAWALPNVLLSETDEMYTQKM